MTTIRRRFALFALLAAAVPLLASSPEYPVGDTVASPAPRSRYSVAAATDGTDFLVVWADGRTPGRSAIMGTRVNASGDVLDPFGILIASVAAGTSWPTAVWDGTAYVVVWGQSAPFGQTLEQSDVFATRVDRDGRVLMEPRIISRDGHRGQATTSSGAYAASNGRVTLIAYEHLYGASAVKFAILDREGNIVGREVLPNPAPGFSRGMSVAATATRFVVTWSTNDERVFAAPLTSEGRALRAPMQIGAGLDPAVASDGTAVAFLWRRWMPDRSENVLLSRTADADLAQLGDVETLASNQIIDWPSLLWRGSRYEAIAGQQSHTPTRAYPYGLLSIEFDRHGVELVSHRRGGPLSTTVGPQPVAVTNGSDVLVAHIHPDYSRRQIVARLYRGSAPDPVVEHMLSWSANAHESPVIASGASGHIAAWIENLTVYATRIDASGRSLDGRGIELAKGGSAVRAAFDGTNYIVAWLDNGFIGVRSIAPLTGATVAEVRVPVAAWHRERLALAVSAEAVYLAWVDAADHRVRVTRVAAGSAAADLPLVVSPSDMIAGYPALAWNGSMLLVVWNELQVPSGNIPGTPALSVLAARVSGGLSLLDPVPVVVATAGASLLGPPSAASNGEDWLVAVDRDERHIVARRVLRGGAVEGAAESTIADGVAPSVTWSGKRYAIAYKSGGTWFQPQAPVLVATIPATGVLAAIRGTVVSTDAVSVPSVARTAGSDVAVIYTRVSEQTAVERSYVRVMDLDTRRRVIRH